MNWTTDRVTSRLFIHTCRTPIGTYVVREEESGVSCGMYPMASWTMARFHVYKNGQEAIAACEKHWQEVCQKIEAFNNT